MNNLFQVDENSIEQQFAADIVLHSKKMNDLLQVDENSIEQYFAAHIVLGC